ncbi:unnamed protein product [Rangifer tarandus platyrhynchus]|uniref:Uncharacterized protein n=1 Tax=Rangifer tarandus platyrhynchus TaxID=3082113 RepID=A0AC59ZBM0_RANTA
MPPNSHSAGRSAASSCPPAGSGSLRLRASWGGVGRGGGAGLPSHQQTWQGATRGRFSKLGSDPTASQARPPAFAALFLRAGSRRAYKPMYVTRVLSPFLLHTALLTAGRTGPKACAPPGSGRGPDLRGSRAPPPCAPVTSEKQETLCHLPRQSGRGGRSGRVRGAPQRHSPPLPCRRPSGAPGVASPRQDTTPEAGGLGPRRARREGPAAPVEPGAGLQRHLAAARVSGHRSGSCFNRRLLAQRRGILTSGEGRGAGHCGVRAGVSRSGPTAEQEAFPPMSWGYTGREGQAAPRSLKQDTRHLYLSFPKPTPQPLLWHP